MRLHRIGVAGNRNETTTVLGIDTSAEKKGVGDVPKLVITKLR